MSLHQESDQGTERDALIERLGDLVSERRIHRQFIQKTRPGTDSHLGDIRESAATLTLMIDSLLWRLARMRPAKDEENGIVK